MAFKSRARKFSVSNRKQGVKMFQGLVPIVLAAVHFRQGHDGRGRQGLVPRGLGQGRVGRGKQRLLRSGRLSCVKASS